MTRMKTLLLAGGRGSRLWPLSSKQCPKQFLKIGSPYSYFQKTVLRLLTFIKPEDILVVCIDEHVDQLRKDLEEIQCDLKIAVEPEGKNSGPAIAFGARILREEMGLGQNDLFLTCPSDHMIDPPEAFEKAVQKGIEASEKRDIVSMGIRPTHPHTGYGYIKMEGGKVAAFYEKPPLEKAKQFLKQGNFFWNAGIFLFPYSTFVRELEKHAPELHALAKGDKRDYVGVSSLSIDYALIEKTDRLKMVPFEGFWSDIGSWETLYESLAKDDDVNAKVGAVATMEAQNNLIINQGEKRIVAIGVEDLLIVENENTLLIAKRKSASLAKHFVEEEAPC